MIDIKSPDKWSTLGMYGRCELFEQINSAGFTEVSFGIGEWKNDFRIVAIFVAFHPDGRVWTYQHPKLRSEDLVTYRGIPFEQIFRTKEKFDKYCKKHHIEVLSTNAPMAKVLAEYGIAA